MLGFDWIVFGVAGAGRITGRASCASSELTTPKLGARNDGPDRDTMVGIDDGVGVVLLACCNNCFNKTFCDSSGLWIVTVVNLQLSVIFSVLFGPISVADAFVSSFSSLMEFDASMLL